MIQDDWVLTHDPSKMDHDAGSMTFGSRPRTQAKWVMTHDLRAWVLTSNPKELDPDAELKGNWFYVWSTQENYNKNNNIYSTNSNINTLNCNKNNNIYNTNNYI
jgi:hypothetical protein